VSLLQALPAGVPKTQACRALGVPRHWCYPDKRQRASRPRSGARQPRQLTPAQQAETLAALHSERFQDQAPRQVYGALLSEGTKLASVSTMYRLLRAGGESRPRRAQRPPQRHIRPRLTARAPNECWTWDITKLPTYTRGVYLSLYVILDLFSRYVVGWMVSRKENAGLARHLFARVLAHHGIAPGSLIVHQDRGAPMIAHSFADLMSELGVERSYSRPRVSNDNAFSESQFKTLKFDPSYPGRFVDPADARTWGRTFFPYYNTRPHEGLALFTPADVFTNRIEQTWAVRQAALDRHYADHPERYVNGPPRAARPPSVVAINPDDATPASELMATPDGFASKSTPVSTELPEVVT
jgi:putative transposase